MVSREYAEKLVTKAKKKARRALKGGKPNEALEYISISANMMYISNIRYRDDDLETMLEEIAEKLIDIGPRSVSESQNKVDTLIFYDGFGLEYRGLALIYLRALCRLKRVIYVTYLDKEGHIPTIQGLLKEHNGEVRYIKDSFRGSVSYIEKIRQLEGLIKEYRPGQFFFYSMPDDVVATTVMYAYKGGFERFQVNLTDHAFWLGAGCLDTCIEFRDYGAYVSREYRRIAADRIRIIPYYPVIVDDKGFQGYPFEKSPGQKVVFSGGALYKTFGDGNRYYNIVDHILESHTNVIFWYAGSGDSSEMDKLIRKYPGRVFLTKERQDLMQVMRSCSLYLSTYPLSGGLMFQYAALAGKVPVTLKKGDESDGVLIGQESLCVEYYDDRQLYAEIDKLLEDDGYANFRGERMKDSVISQTDFEYEVELALCNKKSDRFVPVFKKVNVDDFREWFLETCKKKDLLFVLYRCSRLKIGLLRRVTQMFDF